MEKEKKKIGVTHVTPQGTHSCGVPVPTERVEADISSPTTTEEEGWGQIKALEAGVHLSTSQQSIFIFVMLQLPSRCQRSGFVKGLDIP